jgi:NADPH-dependent 2,4-dienoyl-CoA reductase/sulfur reductase-like enzyme
LLLALRPSPRNPFLYIFYIDFSKTVFFLHPVATGVPMQVIHFINLTPEQQKTQPPLGYEAEASGAADGAAAAGEAEPEKPKGRVIVVGAGPAGMAAASVLQVRRPRVCRDRCPRALGSMCILNRVVMA